MEPSDALTEPSAARLPWETPELRPLAIGETSGGFILFADEATTQFGAPS